MSPTEALSPETERLVRSELACGQFPTRDALIREGVRLVSERREFEQAVSEGLADADAGRTRPLRDVDADLRRKHGIGPAA